MKLIVGLGNPGAKYERTRHNAGAEAVKAFRDARLDAFNCWSNKFNSEVCEGRLNDEKVILLLPQTFMNLSGGAVQEASAFWKIDPADIIVIYDDLDLPFGTLRIKTTGSAGGHNGVKSIIERLGSKDFIRMRIGIGTAMTERIPAEDFVLQRFSEPEMDTVKETYGKVIKALSQTLKEGPEAAMNNHNE